MMYWNNHMTSGGWIVSIVATVVILALVVAVFVWISRELRNRRDSAPSSTSSALEILDRRLASGEIKADQYEQLRHTLTTRPQ